MKELYSLINFCGREAIPQYAYKVLCPMAVPFIDTDVFEFSDNGPFNYCLIDTQEFMSTKSEKVRECRMSTPSFWGELCQWMDQELPQQPGAKGHKFQIRYIRENLSYGVYSFKVEGDPLSGVITDESTGLVWDQYDSGKMLDWKGALKYMQQKNQEHGRG